MKKLYFLYFIFSISAHAGTHKPQEFLEQVKGSSNEGKQIYDHFCVNCHAKKPLIPLGAPRIRVKEDWLFRLKAGAKIIFKHTDEGFNGMPPRGGCFECSDEQLLLAIIEMLPKKTKKDFSNELSEHKKNKK